MNIQIPIPSPFIASVVPGKDFDPECHVAFGNVFLEYAMSPLADEIRAFTGGVGMPDRADQGWITLVGAETQEVVYRLIGVDIGPLSPGTGCCRIQTNAVAMPGCPMDLYVGQGEVYLGLPRIAVSNVLVWLQSQSEFSDITVRDDTESVVRIAVMGPEVRTFLRSLDVPDDRLRHVGLTDLNRIPPYTAIS